MKNIALAILAVGFMYIAYEYREDYGAKLTVIPMLVGLFAAIATFIL